MFDCDGSDWMMEAALFGATSLRSSPSERLTAVRSLPRLLLPVAMADPAVEVRREVARLISEDWLGAMAWDRDWGVRLIVAGRLRPEQAVILAHDSDARVRALVAGRVALTQNHAPDPARLSPSTRPTLAGRLSFGAARSRRRLI